MPHWLEPVWSWASDNPLLVLGLLILVPGANRRDYSLASAAACLGFGLSDLLDRHGVTPWISHAFVVLGWLALAATVLLIYRNWRLWRSKKES
jgi:hypothetical protein